MNTKDLMPSNPVTEKGDRPSQELIEIIQRLTRKCRELEARLEALQP